MQFRMVRRFSLVVATFFFTVFPSFVLAGESPKSNDSVVADSAKNLPAVHLDGNYFSRDGQRFLPVGANWVPAKAAMQWPTQWDPKAIEADFAQDARTRLSTRFVSTCLGVVRASPRRLQPGSVSRSRFPGFPGSRYQIYLHPSLC